MGNYNLDSVQKLDFFSAVRKYPGMYIGSKDADGLHHLAKEIISNSIDEYLNGSCNKIDITLFSDGSLQIKDNGRGIPIGKKEGSNKTALELCFTEEPYFAKTEKEEKHEKHQEDFGYRHLHCDLRGFRSGRRFARIGESLFADIECTGNQFFEREFVSRLFRSGGKVSARREKRERSCLNQ